MIVALIGKKGMYKTRLPEYVSGNYSIIDENDKKLISIESKNKKWYVFSNDNINIVDKKDFSNIINNGVHNYLKSNSLKSIELKEYNFYYILLGNLKEIWILYCYPSYETYMHLEITKKTDISIGRDDNNIISFDNDLVMDRHARIYFNNGQILLQNFEEKFGCFINSKHVTTSPRLIFYGDIIFIMGLKIIIMGKNIYINNPLNKVKYNPEVLSLVKKQSEIPELKKEDEEDIELYNENDYYAKAPRITNVIEREKIKIDPPPQAEKKETIPVILTLGSTLSMGAVMMVTSSSTMINLASGKTSIQDAWPSLLTSAFMLIGILVIPIFQRRYEKKQRKKNEEKRQKRYKKYIDLKSEQIDNVMKKQRDILLKNFISADECNKIIQSKNSRLWERNIEDYDFITLRLGIGDVPLEIDINYPEEKFSMEDDNLVEILSTIGNKSKILENAPITVSLAQKNICAIIAEEDSKIKEKFLQSIIMQLITLHSYEELKLVFLLKKDKLEKWEHMKMLPHIWDSSKQIRFYADEYNDMLEISRYLEEDFARRANLEKDLDYRSFSPYYLIITDDYKKVEGLKIVNDILSAKQNRGFSILYITDSLTKLPNECKTFITLENDGSGKVFESEIMSTTQKEFKFDSGSIFFFEKICKEISNIPLKYSISKKAKLPNSLTFLEMYDVGKIEQLNILYRWKNNDSTMSLKAPVGIDTSGNIITLDVHEKFHGPHGLIAGSTGSGKSEFIITYILSLAINYHPDDVAFVLIDYKGGGLAGAFQKKDIKLPHLTGTITNIDTVGLQRSLSSIQSELKRRQVMFNEARNEIDEGTIDIYKYQKLYHQGIVNKAIPHLFIICDEFAELKQQQPDFMDELISVARIGRSLGVHLILATQKPAGIVNDQIRSNSKFGICLKVQTVEDSRDVIGKSDAADLKSAGQFYMNVGNNEYYKLGLSGWSGAPYYPSDNTKKKVDNNIDVISNIGSIIKQVKNENTKNQKNNGEQLTNIVKYIARLAKLENIKTKNLWLESIPETIYVDEIRKKYKIDKKLNYISPVIGEFDDPYNQRQGALIMDLSGEGNTVIFGNADSGKETLISTAIYDTINNYGPDEVQFYVFDFGSEALKVFKNAPQIGDVMFLYDTEKISRCFEILQRELKRRITILSEYGGDYKLYLKTSGKIMPMIVVIINNYESFSENFNDKYDDLMSTLTRDGIKCGIIFMFVASTVNALRYRLLQNFKKKIALQLNRDDDYYNVFDKIGKKRPSNIFGRGLVELEEIYEFQTAKICNAEEWNVKIKNLIIELNNKYNIRANPIPVIPEIITIDNVKNEIKDISCLPVGISTQNLEIFKYNFKKNFVNIITSSNINSCLEYIVYILEEIKLLKNTLLFVLDSEGIFESNKENFKATYQKFKLSIENDLSNNYNVLCIIIGIDKFINELQNGETELNEILIKSRELRNYNYIIVDRYNKLKSREYNQWYKEFIYGDSGIWIGRGIREQFLISMNNNDSSKKNNCGKSYGYVIQDGEAEFVKLIGMKENGDIDG